MYIYRFFRKVHFYLVADTFSALSVGSRVTSGKYLYAIARYFVDVARYLFTQIKRWYIEFIGLCFTFIPFFFIDYLVFCSVFPLSRIVLLLLTYGGCFCCTFSRCCLIDYFSIFLFFLYCLCLCRFFYRGSSVLPFTNSSISLLCFTVTVPCP